MLNQGLMQHHEEIVDYFNTKGVSAIFLFRRNLLRRMISILANSCDQNAKLLNGTHKSHVHLSNEVSLSLFLTRAQTQMIFYLHVLNSYIVSGRNTCKIQTYCQCDIAHTQFEASRRDGCQSFSFYLHLREENIVVRKSCFT
ncbi:Somatomedin-B and thrombospondin type-1 domain-containing protein [Actinidia chinensis var. chinensis]|uniref:Somatomedin-B and thrombospondin type-1 domain-containing protein n=1 Tax=Actinidia chinensis var. chinensis TaxID=1590841 RepID=A0A2R6R1S1_ACTCC|nr:Somatomedin-B and thrombospondin type-1 domain-containing protein [Actinidia chinensis var. chinensis]